MSKVTIPNTIEGFNNLDSDLSTTVASGLWKKAAELAEYINQSCPVGMVIWIRQTQDLLPEAPDPKYWQEMDGTTISNALSPLDGVTLPDLTGHFLKHASALETNQTAGGTDTKGLTHNHGGVTGATNPRDTFNGDNNTERPGPYNHTHTIANALGVLDIKPLYRDLRFYIRIV